MRKTRLQCTCHLLSISQLLASCISYLMYAFSMEVATLGYKALLPICYNMVVACSSTKLISQNSSGTFRKDSKGEKTLSIVPVKQLQFLSSKQMTKTPIAIYSRIQVPELHHGIKTTPKAPKTIIFFPSQNVGGGGTIT